MAVADVLEPSSPLPPPGRCFACPLFVRSFVRSPTVRREDALYQEDPRVEVRAGCGVDSDGAAGRGRAGGTYPPSTNGG